MYGRGIASIAEVLGCTKEKAQEIMDAFFNAFPDVRKWIDETYAFVRKMGYVTDYSGRRRRLPDVNLPKYSFEIDGKSLSASFNPLLGCKNKYKRDDDPRIVSFRQQLAAAKSFKEITAIKETAKALGITIIDNGNAIAQAERQCVNARIQGGAATLTKLAMIKIYNDEFMKERDAKLIINVHDELLMECPEQYAQECADRLAYDMCQAAIDYGIDIPMKCDADVFEWWYQDQVIGDVKKEMKKKDLIKEVVLADEKYALTDDMIYTFKKIIGGDAA